MLYSPTLRPDKQAEFLPHEDLVLWEPDGTDDSKRPVLVPPVLCQFLRAHQREGVQFMFECGESASRLALTSALRSYGTMRTRSPARAQ